MAVENIPYKVFYRRIKYPRLEFTTGELHFILPLNSNRKEIFNRHRRWIEKKWIFVQGCLKESKRKKLAQRTDDDFKKLVLSFLSEAASQQGLKPQKVYFRPMKTKWASLSTRKNLTINKLAKYLPDYLIEYIIIHELAHFKQKRHNEFFWEIISHRYKNYQELERELFIYWFRLTNKP